jgi:hypothetical protein
VGTVRDLSQHDPSDWMVQMARLVVTVKTRITKPIDGCTSAATVVASSQHAFEPHL